MPKGDWLPDLPSNSTLSSKRKLSHVSRACSTCRRRKSRCDGAHPCSSCTAAKLECVYAADVDGRRLASKSLVDALQARVKVLEKICEEHGIDYELEGVIKNDAPAKEDPCVSDKPKFERTRNFVESDPDDLDGARDDVDRLKLDDTTGELHHYGPTSAWAYAPTVANQPKATTSSHSSGHDSDHPASPNSPYRSFSGWTPPRKLSVEDVNWARPLPPGISLDLGLHEQLPPLYFNYFNPWNCWVTEHLFRRDLAACLGPNRPGGPIMPDRTAHYSPMLHNAILGIACFYSDDPRVSPCVDENLTAIWEFIQYAKDAIDCEVNHPLISTISGLMVLGSLHSGAGKQGAGWYFAGAALRMSTTLGLGIDATPQLRRGIITLEIKSTREQTFWNCYIQDKLWSTYVGRDVTISASHFDAPLPQIVKEQDDIVWRTPLEPAAGPDDKTYSLESYVSLTFYQTAKLSLLAERLMDAIYSLKVNLSSPRMENVVSDLHCAMELWRSELPPAVQISVHSNRPHPSHVILLHNMYWFLSILLHRPFFPRPGYAPTPQDPAFIAIAVKQCQDAATKTMQLLQLYKRCPGLRYAPVSLTQMTFAAGTIQVLSADYGERSPKRSAAAIGSARMCIGFLREMPWKCSAQSATGLEARIAEQIANSANISAQPLVVAYQRHPPPPPSMTSTSAKMDTPSPAGGREKSSPSSRPARATSVGSAASTGRAYDVQQALTDPGSKLARELRAMGWVPPSVQALSPGGSGSSGPNSARSSFSAPVPGSATFYNAVELASSTSSMVIYPNQPHTEFSNPLMSYPYHYPSTSGPSSATNSSTSTSQPYPGSYASSLGFDYNPYAASQHHIPSSLGPTPTSYQAFDVAYYTDQAMMSFFDQRDTSLGLSSSAQFLDGWSIEDHGASLLGTVVEGSGGSSSDGQGTATAPSSSGGQGEGRRVDSTENIEDGRERSNQAGDQEAAGNWYGF